MTTDRELLADCRARLAFDLLANTWNAVLLWSLRHGPRRPRELLGMIGGISPKVLTETLRRLTYNGLVTRASYAGSPPRVEYELTALGRTLLAPIEAFGVWAHEHGDAVMAAQERADTEIDADADADADTGTGTAAGADVSEATRRTP
ncbi:winged helix-turn-helix transcriptional regulator [Streptomyces sp. NPDC087300]|uniref:winged helix-turn-helix transcriptional regulator n=1 Tax=Streptomyces sp. NPDC087300 TaxID=3365780 RepID=UPI00381E2BDE